MKEDQVYGVEVNRAHLLLRGLLEYVDFQLAFAMDLAAFENAEPELEHWSQNVCQSVEGWISKFPELNSMPIMFSVSSCPEGCHVFLNASPEFDALLLRVGIKRHGVPPLETQMTHDEMPAVISPRLH